MPAMQKLKLGQVPSHSASSHTAGQGTDSSGACRLTLTGVKLNWSTPDSEKEIAETNHATPSLVVP